MFFIFDDRDGEIMVVAVHWIMWMMWMVLLVMLLMTMPLLTLNGTIAIRGRLKPLGFVRTIAVQQPVAVHAALASSVAHVDQQYVVVWW